MGKNGKSFSKFYILFLFFLKKKVEFRTVFIDTHYDQPDIPNLATQTEKFNEYTDELWKFASEGLSMYLENNFNLHI